MSSKAKKKGGLLPRFFLQHDPPVLHDSGVPAVPRLKVETGDVRSFWSAPPPVEIFQEAMKSGPSFVRIPVLIV